MSQNGFLGISSPPADNPQHNSSEADSRSLDQLLAFIQGGEEGEGGGVSPVTMTTNNSSKTGKKKKKTKKIHVRKILHSTAH